MKFKSSQKYIVDKNKVFYVKKVMDIKSKE